MVARPRAFFLPTSVGERFCLYFATTAAMSHGVILYVHPYAEEMNKARRMAAEQARRFARVGWDVLLLDLHGCGDSEGDSIDSTWATWHEDLSCGWHWLEQRAPKRKWLWGTRLGALLASDFSQSCSPRADGLLLWQPVASGAQHLNQFLRLRAVRSMLNPGESGADTKTLKQELEAGNGLEIAGYGLSPVLAKVMATQDLARMNPRVTHVRWFEVSSIEGASISPVGLRIAEAWAAVGIDTDLAIVHGPAFWQTQEIESSQALLDVSTAALEKFR